MRKAITLLILPAVLALTIIGCDLLDSSNVTNPNISEEEALNNPNPLQRWMRGLEAQMVTTLNNTLLYTVFATDNYENTQTFYNQEADNLNFLIDDSQINSMFFAQSELRESALFGKDEVAQREESPNPDFLAELDFYLGMSHLFLGEHFLNAPLEAEGEPASPEDHYARAISAFQDAIDSGSGDQTAYKLAQARAYYNDGNISEARARAQEVLDADPDFLRLRETDPLDGPSNALQTAMYDRETLNDLQPLPRLDFLDPKYGAAGANDTPYVLLKAEEAHAILIEADLAEGNALADIQNRMNALIDLAQSRGTRPVDETGEGRLRESPDEGIDNWRPDRSEYEVRASEDDPFRQGLVLDRTANTEVPSVSGTSVTESMVDDISDMDEAWEMYYLLRQEIFIAEGRRFVTFGLKLPLPENELLVNDNIDEATATEFVIPDFIPDPPRDMNAFTWTEEPEDVARDERDVFQATIEINMNRQLANNRTSVSPFLQ